MDTKPPNFTFQKLENIEKEFEKWSRAADRMGEWLIVGSIAAAGLDAVPGTLALVCLFVFFFIRPQNQPPPHLNRYLELKKGPRRSAVEEEEFEKLSELAKPFDPARGVPSFTFGYVLWGAALLYDLVVKGVVRHQWG